MNLLLFLKSLNKICKTIPWNHFLLQQTKIVIKIHNAGKRGKLNKTSPLQGKRKWLREKIYIAENILILMYLKKQKKVIKE